MKTKLKVQEYLKRILCIVMLIVLFTPKPEVQAAVSVEDAGAAIASFSIDFFNKYGNRVTYYCDGQGSDWQAQRAAAYNETTVGSMQEYKMDCVGWVSYAIHHATGLDKAMARAGTGGFVAPGFGKPNEFDDVTGQDLKPGDILANSHHVMVYVGDNKIVHCAKGLQYQTLEEYGNENYTRAKYGGGRNGAYDYAYRLSASTTATIDESNLAPIISGINSGSSTKKKDFGYIGLPSKGQYTGSKGTLSLLKAIINVLSQILDYLVGLITLGIKIELVGWTTIIENIITDAINEITGTEIQPMEKPGENENNTVSNAVASANTDTNTSTETEEGKEEEEGSLYTPGATETVTGTFTDKNDRITVEKIVFNLVPIFDVNIFNLEEAGGQKLEPDGTLAIIKRSIAKWYYVFRNVAIIGLLLVLLYIGIKMAISTAVEEKALYKRYLKDWVVSFIIVFCIHYIMVFVLNVNDYLVSMMKDTTANGEYFLYETVRTKAYELKFTSGIAGTVMYMVLVYLMIKYLFVYMKRYLTINILAIIAPIIGISYSIDKLKDNKSQSMKAWLHDFVFTTLLQSVHALLYTIFIPMALQSSEENLAGIVFAFILLDFMADADKILINIFGMSSGKALKNILKGDGAKNLFAKVAAVKGVGRLYKKGAQYAGKAVVGVGKTVGEIGGVVLPEKIRFGFNDWYNNTADKVLGENNFLNKRKTSNDETSSSIDEKLREAKQAYKRETMQQIKEPFKFAKTGIKFFAGSMVAIPMLVINPKDGISKMLEIKGYQEILRTEGKKAKLNAKKSEKGVNNVIANKTKNGNKNSRIKGRYNAKKEEVQSMQTRFGKSINMLEQAKSLEQEIVRKYAKMKKDAVLNLNIGAGTSPAASRMAQQLLDKMNKQYDSIIDDLFKEVKHEDIEIAMEHFERKEKKIRIEQSDFDNVIKMLEERLDENKKNDVEISSTDLKSNMDKLVANNFTNRLSKGMDSELKKHNITWEEADKEKQKDIIKDLNKALSKTNDEAKLLAALNKSLSNNNVSTAISNKAKKDIISNALRKKQDEDDKTYSSSEVVNLMKTALKKKGSIKRDVVPSEFDDIVKDIESLNTLNTQYEKEFGQKIFTNEEIISAMKNTKRAGK